ncbi:DsbA family protein [Candidatus Liberibacter brunswickensis]|uniref:DsbA family protein n=1 Tax=Candidatus Liberibacter brunswickensis TaxID=1968796 RepID=UPI002FE29D45
MSIIKVGTLGVVVLIITASLFFYVRGKESVPSSDLPSPYGVVDVHDLLSIPPGAMKEISIGKKDAPVTMVEYASTTCSHCAEFHNKTFKFIRDKYIKTGKLLYILREFPLDSISMASFMLARCAENRSEGGYLSFVSFLFSKQNDLINSKNYRESLLNMAKFAGFSKHDFDACLADQSIMDDIKAKKKIASENFSIDSTPVFFIEGNLYLGNMSEDVFSKLIDRAIQDKSVN